MSQCSLGGFEWLLAGLGLMAHKHEGLPHFGGDRLYTALTCHLPLHQPGTLGLTCGSGLRLSQLLFFPNHQDLFSMRKALGKSSSVLLFLICVF